jgi:hypothetical protein
MTLTHRMSKSPEFKSWIAMRRRCRGTTGSADHVKYYRDKGITVCPEWDASFEQFLSDMGPKPTPRHSIDRINNDLGYFPSNCRWADHKSQCLNRRSNIRIEINGTTKTVSEWARAADVPPGRIARRLHSGWSPTDAVYEPPKILRGKGEQ